MDERKNLNTSSNVAGQAAQEATIDPVRLGRQGKFKFKCHPGVSCFTQCCRGISITLTPYDVIILKKRLDLNSRDFLSVYTDIKLLEKTDLPVAVLKQLEDEACPFVRKDGCLIYADRPTACRYYPLGTATLQHKEGADDEGFFFFVNEPHCKGFEEDCEWTVDEWRKDQAVDIRDAVNSAWTDLIVRKRSFPSNIKLTEEAKRMFFMVSYDLDSFRAFVFESTFLKRFPADEPTLEKISHDDVELLKFGLSWLKDILFTRHDPQAMAAAGNRKPA
jgi:Fe-S-cluster containining protein